MLSSLLIFISLSQERFCSRSIRIHFEILNENNITSKCHLLFLRETIKNVKKYIESIINVSGLVHFGTFIDKRVKDIDNFENCLSYVDPNTDIIIYIKFDKAPISTEILEYQVETGVPSKAIINMNLQLTYPEGNLRPQSFESKEKRDVFEIFLHETFYALGLKRDHIYHWFNICKNRSYFKNETLCTSSSVYKNAKHNLIITPNIVKLLQDRFGKENFSDQCTMGLEFSDSDGFHLVDEWYFGEIMNLDPNNYKRSKISKIVLTLLQDTGYYNVDMSKAEELEYGDIKYLSNVSKCDYKCFPNGDPNNTLPNHYQPQKYPEWKKYELENTCSYDHRSIIRLGSGSNKELYISCLDSGLFDGNHFSDFGLDSRCSWSSLSTKDEKKKLLSASCFPTKCLDNNTLIFYLNNKGYKCVKDGIISIESYEGYFYCPNPSFVCGLNDKPNYFNSTYDKNIIDVNTTQFNTRNIQKHSKFENESFFKLNKYEIHNPEKTAVFNCFECISNDYDVIKMILELNKNPKISFYIFDSMNEAKFPLEKFITRSIDIIGINPSVSVRLIEENIDIEDINPYKSHSFKYVQIYTPNNYELNFISLNLVNCLFISFPIIKAQHAMLEGEKTIHNFFSNNAQAENISIKTDSKSIQEVKYCKNGMIFGNCCNKMNYQNSNDYEDGIFVSEDRVKKILIEINLCPQINNIQLIAGKDSKIIPSHFILNNERDKYVNFQGNWEKHNDSNKIILEHEKDDNFKSYGDVQHEERIRLAEESTLSNHSIILMIVGGITLNTIVMCIVFYIFLKKSERRKLEEDFNAKI